MDSNTPASQIPIRDALPRRELYQTLDSSRFEIRCFLLHRGEFDDPIRGILKVVSLDDAPQYEALSYVWGEELAPSSITLTGSQVSITKNLDGALRHIREQDKDRSLWIDALSINQRDIKEKAEQVRFMGAIYSKAERVLAWLGHANESLAPVRDFLKRLSEIRESLRSIAHDAKESVGRGTSSQGDLEFAPTLRVQPRPTEVLRGLSELFSRPYWERVWIIQELSKAQHVEIGFGNFRVQLNPLLLASRNLKDVPERTRTLLGAIIRFRAQEQGYGGLSTNHRMSLIDALVTSRYSLASDPRDKIYALLGMTCDGSNFIPLPTYSRPVSDVFKDLTSAMIRSQQPSNVLLFPYWAPVQDDHEADAKWSVDWAGLGYHLPHWLTKTNRLEAGAVPSRAEFDGSSLFTTGNRIATINHVQGKGRDYLPSPQTADLSISPAVSVMKTIASDLLDRLAPGFRPTTELNETDLVDALARMIRDANKGDMTTEYDIRSVLYILDQLASLSWDAEPVWEWARNYNYIRSTGDSRSQGSPRNSDESGSEPSSRNVGSGIGISPKQKSHKEARQAPISSRVRGLFGRTSTAGDRPSTTRGSASRLQVHQPAAKAPPSPRPQASPLAAFHFWQKVLLALDMAPEFKLRFAQASFVESYAEHLVLVCDRAERGHQIYRVEQAHLPLVLRETRGGYDLVGEVCIARNPIGEWTRDDVQPPGALGSLEGSLGSPKSNRGRPTTLRIRLGSGGLRTVPSYDSLYRD